MRGDMRGGRRSVLWGVGGFRRGSGRVGRLFVGGKRSSGIRLLSGGISWAIFRCWVISGSSCCIARWVVCSVNSYIGDSHSRITLCLENMIHL